MYTWRKLAYFLTNLSVQPRLLQRKRSKIEIEPNSDPDRTESDGILEKKIEWQMPSMEDSSSPLL